VLHGGGNTSVKAPFKDIFGNDIPALYVKGSGWDLASIEKEGFAPVGSRRRCYALCCLARLDAAA
jgi:rhamnose utilization protein RhaD (predicted bifunctional aldolase and dehydrogenase)